MESPVDATQALPCESKEISLVELPGGNWTSRVFISWLPEMMYLFITEPVPAPDLLLLTHAEPSRAIAISKGPLLAGSW